MARIGFFLLASAFFLFIVVDCHVPETEVRDNKKKIKFVGS